MKKEWIHPNTITGDAATNEQYLRRDYINEYFWREVKKGNHILFVAPRRVGKTSIMKDLAENCPEGFVCIYQSIEGVSSRNEFYRRLFELILQCVDRSKIKQAKEFIEKCMKKYSIKEISKFGIVLDSREIDYEREIRDLIPELKKSSVHAVIFLDEFAEVIHKLKKNGKQEDAIDILHTLREIRSDDDFEHFTVVYAGSVGLEFVIKQIARPKLINDLHAVQLNALTDPEATRLITQLTNGATIQLPEDVQSYLKQKIGYLLPYYLHLMIEELNVIAFENKIPEVTIGMVDMALQNILSRKKNFEDWILRLKEYYAENFAFINEILKHAAHYGRITVQEVYDRAKEFGRMEDYMDFIDELLNDGYLVEQEKHIYHFTSPLLHQFWLQKYPVRYA
jgi:hypothetical protein